jgi:hypothetical protein
MPRLPVVSYVSWQEIKVCRQIESERSASVVAGSIILGFGRLKLERSDDDEVTGCFESMTEAHQPSERSLNPYAHRQAIEWLGRILAVRFVMDGGELHASLLGYALDKPGRTRKTLAPRRNVIREERPDPPPGLRQLRVSLLQAGQGQLPGLPFEALAAKTLPFAFHYSRERLIDRDVNQNVGEGQKHRDPCNPSSPSFAATHIILYRAPCVEFALSRVQL